MNKPKIISLNLQPSSSKKIIEKGYNIFCGSLGKLIDTKNDVYDFKYCLLNEEYPENIHEFDIILIDLDFKETIPYDLLSNKRNKNISGNDTYLLCKYPQTIFDPRPLSSSILENQIQEITKRESLIIVFQSKLLPVKYTIVKENGNYPKIIDSEEKNIYNAIPRVPFLKNKVGTETKVVCQKKEIADLLHKYNSKFTYQATFYHPEVWKGDKRILNEYFMPLVTNQYGEIISYIMAVEKSYVLVLPNLEVTSDFLLEFLETVGPSISPSIFPESTKGSWRESSEYFLPNHKELLEKKRLLEEEYNEKLRIKNEEIKTNSEKYHFLHELLIETGDELVAATIKFLEWLGFEEVHDMDDKDPETLEEDIQIESKKGLLVIEVKGIGGTSKDTECGQISKIRYRRAEERGKFDVFGLYIVNHQKHLPPNQRHNPPFTKEQIRDAINDRRGLLTTYQLFKLYFQIEDGLLTKEEARLEFYSTGLIEFKPKNLKYIGVADKTYMNGMVFSVELNDVEIKKGNVLYIERNGQYQTLTIESIQLNKDSVESAKNCRVGIKSNLKIYENTKVYLKTCDNIK